MSGRRAPGRRCLPVLLVLAAAGVCWTGASAAGAAGGDPGPAAGAPALPEPALEGLEPEVADTLGQARRQLAALVAGGGLSASREADVYGELGRLYHAHDVYPPAAAAYRRAADLAPEDFRWRYYLGHLLLRQDAPREAAEQLAAALALRPGYPPLLLHLGLTRLALGEADAAAALLERAAGHEEVAAAALAGLGRLASSRRDFAAARDHYRAALEADPEADRLRVPLAMAARALGDVDAARAHLARRGNREPRVSDPLLDGLQDLLGGARTHYHHAMAAVHARRFDLARESFRAGLSRDPDNVDARVSLARVLYLDGDAEAAEAELGRALAEAPDHALGHLLLGVLLAERGTAGAADHLRATLAAEPDNAGAHHHLGMHLLRAGHAAEAAPHLEAAAAGEPDNLAARLSGVAAARQAGRPVPELVATVRRTLAEHPGDPRFQAALARLLACAPDPAHRRPAEALELARGLFAAAPVFDHAEVLAMAYAAAGRLEDARALQSNILDTALASGRPDLLVRAQDGLARYQAGGDCAAPWHPLDPVLAPPPPAARGMFLDYPAARPY